MKISELPYNRDSEKLFSFVVNEPWSIFLDSGYPRIDTGRYDIITAKPSVTLETYGKKTYITSTNGKIISDDDPFYLVREYLGKKISNLSGLPFCGGALGYFSYDLSRRLENIVDSTKQTIDMPDMAIGIYDWAVIIDHHIQKIWLVSFNRFDTTKIIWQELQDMFLGFPINNDKIFKIKTY